MTKVENNELTNVVKELTQVYRKYREENHSDYNREVAVRYGVTDILNTYKHHSEEDALECLKMEIEDYKKYLKKGAN